MPDELRSLTRHNLVLHRIDRKQAIRRFYSPMIERDLFGNMVLVRNSGPLATNAQKLVDAFTSELEADAAL